MHIFVRRLSASLICCIISLIFANPVKSQAISAEQILEKTASLIKNSVGIAADFTISVNDNTGKGTVRGSGKKFSVMLPDVKVWYNGTDMYTYNSHSRETTVINPTNEELNETNPLLYVNLYKGKYKAAYSSGKAAGKYLIELTPAGKTQDFRKLVFTINSTDYYPEKIVAEMRNGNKITISITSFKTNVGLKSSDFEYPEKSYPGVEVIDLR